MKVLDTERLSLRWLSLEDAPFILELLNEPSFIQNIADRGVRTIQDAENYLLNGPMKMYQTYGFGLFLVELKETKAAVGICGLIQRENLPDVDIGFAFLPKYWSNGLAFESALGVLNLGRQTFGFGRIVAIVNPNNLASIKLLEKLGLKFETHIKLTQESPEVKLFA
jgi:RimJ/RimL family protein N-acetyltransferase